jgi:hypothetical protein
MPLMYPNPNPVVCLLILDIALPGCFTCLLHEVLSSLDDFQPPLLSLVRLTISGRFNAQSPHVARKRMELCNKNIN